MQSEKAHEAATAKGAKDEKPSGGHKSMSRYLAALALRTHDRATYHVAAVLAIVAKEYFDEPSTNARRTKLNNSEDPVREAYSTGHRPRDGVALVPKSGTGPTIPSLNSGDDCETQIENHSEEVGPTRFRDDHSWITQAKVDCRAGDPVNFDIFEAGEFQWMHIGSSDGDSGQDEMQGLQKVKAIKADALSPEGGRDLQRGVLRARPVAAPSARRTNPVVCGMLLPHPYDAAGSAEGGGAASLHEFAVMQEFAVMHDEL